MISTETLEVTINGVQRPVFLSTRRTVKRLTLRIDSKTHKIHLSHPKRCSKKNIRNFLENNIKWLTGQIEKIPPKIIFSPNTTIVFEGINYTLKHVQTTRGIHVYEDADKKIIVSECPLERFPRAIEQFLRREAKETIIYIANKKAETINKKVSSLSIRDTKSRWGSCTSQGALSFSWRLILAPPIVLDYLVAHEVAHLIHMNHSSDFWQTCDFLSHDMIKAKKWLKTNGNLLHRYCTS